MKRIVLIIALMAIGMVGWCQAPQKFKYQAVVRDELGQLVANKDVKIALRIELGMNTGMVVHEEELVRRTNARGLLAVEVGEEKSLVGIDWGIGEYYLHAEITEVDGREILLKTMQRLVSVPFALYGGLADSIDRAAFVEKQVLTKSNDTIFLTGGSFVVLPPYFDGDYNSLEGKPTGVSDFVEDVGYITEEVQVLTAHGDTIFLTGGSYVVLDGTFDGDYNSLTNKPTIASRLSDLINDAGYLTDEVQVLSISNNTIYLTGGSFVKLPFQPEIQNLSDVTRMGNSVGNVQLKDVMDPTDLQDAVTLGYFDSVVAIWTNPDAEFGTFRVDVVDTCDSYMWHGERYTMKGEYTYAYSNEGGFYSVDTLKLTIRSGSYNPEYVSALGSYMWYDSLYTSTGTYTHAYNNEYGCPSVDTLFLTINAGGGASCTAYRFETDTAEVTACGWLQWYGKTIHGSGVFEHSLGAIAQHGCDSVVKIKVQIKPMFQKDTAVRTTTSVVWRGQTYTEQGDYGDTATAANGCDSIYTLHLMIGGNEGIGATSGLFSISNNKQIRFAHGNLQYQSSSNYWKFAEHQYDVLNVTCASKYYSGWSDQFGWGTSGYHNEADTLCVNYQPWSHLNTSAAEGSDGYRYNQYGYGPSRFMTDTNLTGSSVNYDWGMYHPIVNGGNGAGLWRTLTNEEMNYLLNQRNNASGLRGLGRITQVRYVTGEQVDVYGYILLADGWSCPVGLTFLPNAPTADVNSYTTAQWEQLEASGAVFLPIGVGESAYNSYWTSTSGGSGSAYALALSPRSSILAPYNRSYHYGVRLVQEYSAGVEDCVCTYFDTTIVNSGGFAWHGYSYSESGDYMETLVNNAGCDSIVSLSLILEESGELTGVFSVSDSLQVKFSKGNLQYKATSDVWRFSNEQYGYVGTANKFISEHYSGWVDLFAWATSGYHDATDVMNKFYKPWERADYWVRGQGPSLIMRDRHLVGTSEEYDWGVHNRIANGGNQAGLWRTLTKDEWEYLVHQRTNANQLCGLAEVNNVYGLMIMPDNWTPPSGVYFDSNNRSQNVYSDYQWNLLEQSGVVFLPMGGEQNESDNRVKEVGRIASYWSVTEDDNKSNHTNGSYENEPHWTAYALRINREYYGVDWEWKFYRYNVRLVKNL